MNGLIRRLTGARFGASRVNRTAHETPFLAPVPSVARLTAAIEAATFVVMNPDDEGERIAVHCPTLGGGFIYDRAETERRIMRKFPDLVFDDVAASALHLENRVRAFFQPIETASRQKSNWVHGWAYDS